MKRLIMGALPIALSGLLFPLSATAQTSCNASSYIVLPGGQCVDLTYLEFLGSSRATRQQVENIYERQFDANVRLNVAYDQYPQYISETEEERDSRYLDLLGTRNVRDDAVASNEQVETILYPLQVRTMSIMRDAFAPYPYGAPLPDQD